MILIKPVEINKISALNNLQNDDMPIYLPPIK